MIDFADVKEITISDRAVKKIMRGSDVLWEPKPAGPDYLCFTAKEAGSTVAMIKENANAPTLSLEYSMDKQNWNAFVVGSTTVTLANINDMMYLRGNNSGTSHKSGYGANTFVMTGKISANGNIMSILDETVMETNITADYCFNNLFKDCTSLVTAPELPATVLTQHCYYDMFIGCTSLVAAPELPATVLAKQCYMGMLRDCTSLVTAPELPATVLTQDCYFNMFRGCTSLATAPELPATVLTEGCYFRMFEGCTSLNNIRVGFLAFDSNTGNWLSNVSAVGTFTCPSALDTSTRDASHVPAGWTVVNV